MNQAIFSGDCFVQESYLRPFRKMECQFSDGLPAKKEKNNAGATIFRLTCKTEAAAVKGERSPELLLQFLEARLLKGPSKSKAKQEVKR